MDVASFYYLQGGLLFGFLIAAGLTVVSLNQPNYRIARRCAWASAILFGSIAVVWGVTTMESPWIRIPAVGIAGLVAAICLTEALRFIKEREFPNQQSNISGVAAPAISEVAPKAQGGQGGNGEIFGKGGTIIGGKGGNVGAGGVGRGGDGGGGVIHGEGGTIIGGEGGSVDGTNIWYPPAQSGWIQHLESEGQTPDFNIQYPGAGGATGGWLERQNVVVKIREEYFKKNKQEAKIRSSKIEDVPLTFINEKLKEAGYPWRARIEKKYWYLYYMPDAH